MSKRVLIACTMQMDAIRHVVRKYQIEIPIIWLDRKLHNDPKKLHLCIQEQILAKQDAEEILLSYGLCGNAVIGLYSEHTKLVLPAFNDCVCQMLYAESEGTVINSGVPEKGCFYLTREWTIDQESIVPQCRQICEQYGKEYGTQIIKEIYSGYHSLVIVDTGVYDLAKVHRYADIAADYTGMCVKIQCGSCKVIENLLLGRYDKTICILKKGEVVKSSIFQH